MIRQGMEPFSENVYKQSLSIIMQAANEVLASEMQAAKEFL